MAFYVVEDTEEYQKICQDCREGKLLCKECKSGCIDFMIKYISEHQKRREEIKDDVLKWIKDNKVFLNPPK
jgi:tryptophanyl-tRNA synthetase